MTTQRKRAMRRWWRRHSKPALLWGAAILLGSASALVYADVPGKLPANTVYGNPTGTEAAPRSFGLTAPILVSGGALDISTCTGVARGAVPAGGGGTTNFLRADCTWALPSGTGINQLTGPVTAGPGSGSQATSITANAITNAMLAQAGANTMKGNWTSGTANESDNAMPPCADTGGNHLNYVTNTGITCGTSVATTLLASGTSVSLTAPRQYYVCTSTCTVTPPVPAAGYEFCVRNGNNVATVITLAALGSSAMYENTARTAYGTAGTGTLVSGGAVGDWVCVVGLDSTHYLTMSYSGTWTAS